MLDLVVVSDLERNADELAVQYRLERLAVNHVIDVVWVNDVTQGHRHDQMAVKCGATDDAVERHAQMTRKRRDVHLTGIGLFRLVMGCNHVMGIQPPDADLGVFISSGIRHLNEPTATVIETITGLGGNHVVDVVMGDLTSRERFFQGRKVFVIDFRFVVEHCNHPLCMISARPLRATLRR
ncbi:hypothetical protein D9M70_247610 [compost metagenome]